jgi:hypothetical protein
MRPCLPVAQEQVAIGAQKRHAVVGHEESPTIPRPHGLTARSLAWTFSGATEAHLGSVTMAMLHRENLRHHDLTRPAVPTLGGRTATSPTERSEDGGLVFVSPSPLVGPRALRTAPASRYCLSTASCAFMPSPRKACIEDALAPSVLLEAALAQAIVADSEMGPRGPRALLPRALWGPVRKEAPLTRGHLSRDDVTHGFVSHGA